MDSQLENFTRLERLSFIHLSRPWSLQRAWNVQAAVFTMHYVLRRPNIKGRPIITFDVIECVIHRKAVSRTQAYILSPLNYVENRLN